jgi:hypothetical protein
MAHSTKLHGWLGFILLQKEYKRQNHQTLTHFQGIPLYTNIFSIVLAS